MPNSIRQVKVLIDPKPKNWIDYVQFGVGVAMPVLALVFGLAILRITKRLEQSQWRSRKFIEKRIQEWDAIRLERKPIGATLLW